MKRTQRQSAEDRFGAAVAEYRRLMEQARVFIEEEKEIYSTTVKALNARRSQPRRAC
jgi:hypothetical protein